MSGVTATFARRLHRCLNLNETEPGLTVKPPLEQSGLGEASWLNSEPLHVVHVEAEGIDYTLPLHWGLVEEGVYRSGFPVAESFASIKRLGVRTVINLQDRLPLSYKAFLAAEGISYIHAPVKGNKVHPEEMDRGHVSAALALISDVAMHPILIHCRSGKHRTGALVGCLRMLQQWSLVDACEEYVNYTFHKQRMVDKQFIERFDPRAMATLMPPPIRLPPWILPTCVLNVSALEAGIRDGLITPEQAAEGIPVPAIVRGPDEPGFDPVKKGAMGGGGGWGGGVGGGGVGEEGVDKPLPSKPPPCVCRTPLALALRVPLMVSPLVGGLVALVFQRVPEGEEEAGKALSTQAPWTCCDPGLGLGTCDPDRDMCTGCPTCSAEKK